MVYFSASSRELASRAADYKAIVRAIWDSNGLLAHNWLEEAANRKGEYMSSIMESIIEQARSSILSSELMVVEASGTSTFGVGYELAFALENKKPILALVKEGSESSSYVVGLKDNLITHSVYNVESVGGIVSDFMEKNMVSGKDLRFNFVIDRQIYNHLRWKSFKSGKTKAEIIRDLLIQDIHKKSD